VKEKKTEILLKSGIPPFTLLVSRGITNVIVDEKFVSLIKSMIV